MSLLLGYASHAFDPRIDGWNEIKPGRFIRSNLAVLDTVSDLFQRALRYIGHSANFE